MTDNQHDGVAQPASEWHPHRVPGVLLKLHPDTKLAEEWYDGEFSIKGGFAKAYLVGLGEMLEIGIAEKHHSSATSQDVYETAKRLPESDAAILLKLGGILAGTKDNPKYSYVRRLLEVLASWPVHGDERGESEAPISPQETQEVLNEAPVPVAERD